LIRLEVPGWSTFKLEHLLLDMNGTIALDGEPVAGVEEQVAVLSTRLAVYLVTADTHGTAKETGLRLGCQVIRIEPGSEASQKRALVEQLGPGQVVAIGNGANDVEMLSGAALGIAVLGREGLAVEAVQAADLVASSIEDAFDLLIHPRRLVATLRR
jgi:P-type E1-E2 ATPase